ncbi:frizzled-10-B-like [Rhopilema esculentum]|uniref:frizzled-10-B-like n=1 Tax=Rhopilema esculentum TaxID=499914 RepID=UPI0031E1FF23|eukprot:gene17252-8813_t
MEGRVFSRLALEFFVIFISVVYGQGLNGDGKCERNRVHDCYGWNYTLVPNEFLGIETQHDAKTRIAEFKPLYKVKCAPNLKLFICAMSVPLCFSKDGVATPVYPCRSMCEVARKGCEPIMKQYNFYWPQVLDCKRLPVQKEGTVCMASPEDKGKPKEPKRNQSLPYKQKCEQHNEFVYVSDGENHECAPKCNASIAYQKKEKSFIGAWVSTWSVICFLSTLLTVSTFLIDPSRFHYPERPIIFLSMCYNLYSVGYLVRVFAGRDAIVCQESRNGKHLISDGMSNTSCTIVFFINYFFGMASSIWWVILSLTWFLSAALKWGHEAVEKYASIFHAIAWTIPTVQTIVALVTRKVDADELSGLCFVGFHSSIALLWFVVIPLFVYLIFGSCFLLSGFIALIRIRRALRLKETNTQKLERLMVRIGIFSMLYSIPASFVVGCFWYEYENLLAVEKFTSDPFTCHLNPECKEIRGVPPAILYMKYFMLLAVGVTSGAWIWSSKTVQSWKKFYYKCCGQGYDDELKKGRKELNHNRGNQAHDHMQNATAYTQRSGNMYELVQPMTMNSVVTPTQYINTQRSIDPVSMYLGHRPNATQFMNTQSMGPVMTTMAPMGPVMTLQQSGPYYPVPVVAQSVVSNPTSSGPYKSVPKTVTPRGSTSTSHYTSGRTTDSEKCGSGGSRII